MEDAAGPGQVLDWEWLVEPELDADACHDRRVGAALIDKERRRIAGREAREQEHEHANAADVARCGTGSSVFGFRSTIRSNIQSVM